MNTSTSTVDEVHSRGRRQVLLPQSVIDALSAFRTVDRKERDRTAWYAMCTTGQPAAVFFKDARDANVFRLTACDLVASAYQDLHSQEEVQVIPPSYVLKLREQASTVRANLPAPEHLPIPANTGEFRSGLDSLCDWVAPVCAPTSKSGDPTRRAFTLSLARVFANAFIHIPVDYIHHLVTIGWPSSSLSATRRVLTSDVTDRIKREVEGYRKQEQVARGTAEFAIQSAASRHAMSDEERLTVAQLEGQIQRIKTGKRRFASDAVRLDALRAIASSFDEPELVDEFVRFIDYKLEAFRP